MQRYESEKLAEHAVDSDFDHTNEAVPAALSFNVLNYYSILPRSFINCFPNIVVIRYNNTRRCELLICWPFRELIGFTRKISHISAL